MAGIEGGGELRHNIKKEKRNDESASSGSDDDDSGSESGSGKDSGTESETGRGRRRDRGGRRAQRLLEGKMRSDAIRARKEGGGGGPSAVEESEQTPPRDKERWEHDKFADMDRSKADRDAASFGAHWSKIKSEKVSHLRNYFFFCAVYRYRYPI